MTDGMFPPSSDDYIWGDKWDQGVDEGLPVGWQEDTYVSIENPWGLEMTYSVEEWHHLVTDFYAEELTAEYGLHTLDIIRELEQEGLWDEDDWNVWRESYEEA